MEGSTKDRKWKCQQPPSPGGEFAFSYSLFIIKKVWDKKMVFREKRSDSTSVTCWFTIMLAQFSFQRPGGDGLCYSLIQVFCTCCILRDVRAVATVGSYPKPVLSWGYFQSALGGGGVQGPGIVIHSTVLSPEYFYTSFKKW